MLLAKTRHGVYMTPEPAIACLQSSKKVKIPVICHLLANSMSTVEIRAVLPICLVIFAIHILPVASYAAPAFEQEAVKVETRIANASIRITGSMCPACLKRLEDKLKQLDGVVTARITSEPAKTFRPSLKAEKHPHYRKALVEVDYQPTQIDRSQIVEAIKQNDFGVLSVSSHKHQQTSQSGSPGN